MSSRVSGSYSVEVWLYIMLFAMTAPAGLATTDFGVMSPVIRSRCARRVVFEGSPGGCSGTAPAAWRPVFGVTKLVASPATIPPAITRERIAIAIVNCS